VRSAASAVVFPSAGARVSPPALALALAVVLAVAPMAPVPVDELPGPACSVCRLSAKTGGALRQLTRESSRASTTVW
jgi:hypothetical protein